MPFDLHVLSMPPAFNLSQDQTLKFFSYASILQPAAYSFLLLPQRQFKAPTQFVFSEFLINIRPEGVLRILLIHELMSTTFCKFLRT